MSRAMSGSVCASDGLSSDMAASTRRGAQAFGATTSRSPVVGPPTARQSQYPKASDPVRPALPARRACAFTCCPLLHCGRGRDSPTSSWPADRMGGGGVHGEAVVMTTTTASTVSLRRTWLRRGGAETVYLLTSLPVAIVSFTVLVTGLSLAGGLMITLVGLPILLLALYAARGFAAVERTRLTWVAGAAATTPRYRGRSGQGAKAWLRLLADRQAWLDVAHALLVFPLAIFTWSLTVTWWSVALFGLPWPLFGHALDRAN